MINTSEGGATVQVTGEWHVTGEPVSDEREQYVVQDGLAAQPGTCRDGEGREVLDETAHARQSAQPIDTGQPECVAGGRSWEQS
ncbi:hypothetical protein [Micromonospora sp. M61]|uniref:hypothetical protein n=1 Tax=Micromonospora sp. M61 TaxID=2824890 RepID=UPI001B384D8D|nr:hypothetical protein [Micromonospora sp. M61]MBQ0982689.1 hypothetical protein [Micromonospora sp. M61]